MRTERSEQVQPYLYCCRWRKCSFQKVPETSRIDRWRCVRNQIILEHSNWETSSFLKVSRKFYCFPENSNSFQKFLWFDRWSSRSFCAQIEYFQKVLWFSRDFQKFLCTKWIFSESTMAFQRFLMNSRKFCDMTDVLPEVSMHKMDISRKFYRETIDFLELSRGNNGFKVRIK